MSKLGAAAVRARDHLLEGGGFDALIVRFESGLRMPDAGATAANYVRRILNEQGRDGAWDGALAATARALLSIRELADAAGIREVDPGIARGLGWLREQQHGPGRFGDGCDRHRHELGVCHHFLAGFFTPAPADTTLEPMTLDSGGSIEEQTSIRFAASALALRALFAWGADSTDLRLHLAGLRRLSEPDTVLVSAPAWLVGLETLIRAPQPTDRTRTAAERAVTALAERQLGDGSWGGVDVFDAVLVLLAAVETGVAAEPARAPLHHAARLLAVTQQDDGGWGDEVPGRRALIAWRAFRAAMAEQASEGVASRSSGEPAGGIT